MYTQLPLLPESPNINFQQAEALPMSDADVIMYRDFYNQDDSDQIFSELCNTIDWRQETTILFGKQIKLPRLTAWYGDPGKSYCYSKIKMEPLLWTSTLIKIKSKIESLANTQFNSVLLNLYRDGKDSVAWHSDDEAELGKNPIIASVSFGATRNFAFRHKFNKELKYKIELTHGSFLLMRGATQHFWQHQIPKTNRLVQARINLTFRTIS